jgi:excisionase family DNA binding protein
MSEEAVAELIGEYAALYAGLLRTDEAAEIARVPVKTIYDWSSRGLMRAFSTRRGKRLLIRRDDFVRFVVTSD